MRSLADLKLSTGDVVFVDRIEATVATLLLGPEGRPEANVPVDQLPKGVREGDRLRVQDDGRLVVDPEATAAGRAAVRSLMEELLSEAGGEGVNG